MPSYSIGHAAKVADVQAETIRVYDRKGLFRLKRDCRGCRVFTDKDLARLIRFVKERKRQHAAHITNLLAAAAAARNAQ